MVFSLINHQGTWWLHSITVVVLNSDHSNGSGQLEAFEIRFRSSFLFLRIQLVYLSKKSKNSKPVKPTFSSGDKNCATNCEISSKNFALITSQMVAVYVMCVHEIIDITIVAITICLFCWFVSVHYFLFFFLIFNRV